MTISALGLLASACAAEVPSAAVPNDQCVAEKLAPGLSIVDAMMSDGLDVSKPRPVSQLFFGDDDRLARLATTLKNDGWDANPDGPGRLLAVGRVGTDKAAVTGFTNAMCAQAEAVGVEWDGWDVDVAADNIKSRQQPQPGPGGSN